MTSSQPFANPQPTPAVVNQAATPPTKQNLKSWWATFRKDRPKHETQGKYSQSHLSSRHPRLFRTSFQEHSMESLSPVSGSFVVGDFSRISSAGVTRPVGESNERTAASQGRFSFTGSEDFNVTAVLPPARALTSFFRGLGNPQLRQQRSHSLMVTTPEQSPKVKRNVSAGIMRRSSSGYSTDSSEMMLGAGIEAGPKRKPLSHVFAATAMKLRWNHQGQRNAKRLGDIVEQPTGIFGVPLRQSITYANVAISLVDPEGKSYIYGYVPIVVAKCGVYLKEKATNVEGIFRLSGSEKRIKELKNIFDSPDRYGKGLDWAGYTVHDAANVLRRYLNQLPEPIVPLDLYDRFREPLRGHTMQAVGDNEGMQLPDTFDMNKAIITYQRLITELPPLNRQLLLYILDLLAVFASKADENRMNSQNLAAIFQPGMLSHPSHDMAPSEYRLSQDVLIFLIENQDNFLIGMRGTAADEQTVQEVSGGTPPPGTPSTPSKSKMVGRSASNASAGADSIRKYGGIRRNVSVSSRNSRQSNGAPSPASPAYNTTLQHTNTGGLHRSNTVPSKKSPGLPSNRLQKSSASPSPTGGMFAPNQGSAPRSLSPGYPSAAPSSPGLVPASPIGKSSLAPSSQAASSAVTSQERLLGVSEHNEKQQETPARERNVSNFFNRSPTAESEKKQPNKLRKKRTPSTNPSAQSSQQSLHGHQLSTSVSPAFPPTRGPYDLVEHPVLESIPSTNPELSTTVATPPAETPRADQAGHQISRPEEHSQDSDKTLKPVTSPPSSLHSHSSFNDQSDADHGDDSAAAGEHREKRSAWKRLSRPRETSQSLGTSLSPKKGMGSNSNAGASSSSVGSASRPRKSFTGDTVPVGSDTTLTSPHPQSTNDSAATAASGEEKKGIFGRLKNKMQQKRDERDDKERNKSPPAPSDRMSTILPGRGKSIDVPRASEEPPAPER
ncbi:Rho-GTPase-activating protein [Lachnellula suecica]|uniref:Rho-GTPase-activating protein n=1 Tax=Lachnellula suecica TaxID=602035 RepID=A0A8T9BRK3_9HELO|nr:Rho-GTPase-activating protein [Lachnellula suecica]